MVPARSPSVWAQAAWIAGIAFAALFTAVGGLNPFNLLVPVGMVITFSLLLVAVLALPYYPAALACVLGLWWAHRFVAHSLALRLLFVAAGGALGYGVFLTTRLAHEPKSDLWDPKVVTWFVIEAGAVSAVLVDLVRIKALGLRSR